MNHSADNIVVRGVNWLGDAVMTTPALFRLREARPNSRITIVTPEKLADLWKHHPAIDDIIAFTPKETAWQIGRRLRWGNFTYGIALPNSPRSAIELWLGRVRNRIGYSRPWRNVFLTQRVSERVHKRVMQKRTPEEAKQLFAANVQTNETVPQEAHQIYDYLHLMSAAVGSNPDPLQPHISVTDEEARSMRRRLLNDVDSGNEVFFGLNPGAEYGPAKRWPKEQFIETARMIQQQVNGRWIIFGAKSDLQLADEIATGIRSVTTPDRIINLAGKTSLRELCVALKVCKVLLSNDTGPAHVAAAVGTPVVIPFGSTSPELTAPGFPGSDRHRFLQSNVACSPCFLRECPIAFNCMKGIEASAVAEAFLSVAKRPATGL